MAAKLESLEDLKSWNEYRTFMKERLKQLPEADVPFYISKEKLTFDVDGKDWKGYAVLLGPKGELAVKKMKKQGLLFREAVAHRHNGKEFVVDSLAPNFVKFAELTFKKLRLGYSVELGDPKGAEEEAPSDVPTEAELKKRCRDLVEEIKRAGVVTEKTTEPFLKEATARATEAQRLIATEPARAAELLAEGEEFVAQARVGVLEGGDPTEAEQLEERRQELLAELKAALKLGEAANEDVLRKAGKGAREALDAIGKRDYELAGKRLDEVEGWLSEVVEGPEPADDFDPDLAGLGDWKAYRDWMKVNLKRLPPEGGPVFVSRKKVEFSIDGRPFKSNAVLVGKKGVITMRMLKAQGVLFREGEGKRDGKKLLVSAIPDELLKGAKKTFLKLRIGRKIVPHGELPPDGDESPEDAREDPTGSRRLDKDVKRVAQALVGLREAIDQQQKYLATKQDELKKLSKDARDALDQAVDLDARGEESEAAYEAADKLSQDEAHAEYITKDLAGLTKRAANDLRELTEKLHRIKDSDAPVPQRHQELQKLRAEVAAKTLDAKVASMDPGDPKTGKLLASQLKKRYGVKFKLYRQVKDGVDGDGNQQYEDRRQSARKEAESLKQLYLTMSKAPDFPKSTLRKIDLSLRPGDATSEGGWYSGSERKVGLTVRRPKESFDYSGQLGSAKYFPDGVDPDCQPANDEPVKYFDWATLHEVAHAVDEKHKFMDGKGSGAAYGKWTEYGTNVAPIAAKVAKKFGSGLSNDDLQKLGSYTVALMKNRTPDPNASDEEKAVRPAVKNWVDSVRVGKSLWWNGSKCKELAIDGVVYQEAYDWSGGWWNSYELSARSKGIHGYQFRAPGEWFAELYAAYYSGKLKPTHPFVPDLAKLEVPSK